MTTPEQLKASAIQKLALAAVIKRVAKTIEFQGITVRIDRPSGFVQRGKDEKGNTWERVYKTDYGYIPKTRGGDGEGIDVYLGPDKHSALAYWISQRKLDGSFDEYKLMLGFMDRRSAKSMWAAHVPERLFGGIATTPIGIVKALLGIEAGPLVKSIGELTFEPDEPAQSPAQLIGRDAMPVELRGALEKVQKCTEVPTRVTHRILKKAEQEERYVLGIVLEPDVVDAQDETYDAATIRAAAHLYLARFRNTDLQHKQLVNHVVELVESYVAPTDMTIAGVAIKEGTWLMAHRILDDELWEAVKTGAIGGYSIHGVAVKVDPVTGQVIPPPPEEARMA
jgi:hypothetical protein